MLWFLSFSFDSPIHCPLWPQPTEIKNEGPVTDTQGQANYAGTTNHVGKCRLHSTAGVYHLCDKGLLGFHLQCCLKSWLGLTSSEVLSLSKTLSSQCWFYCITCFLANFMASDPTRLPRCLRNQHPRCFLWTIAFHSIQGLWFGQPFPCWWAPSVNI